MHRAALPCLFAAGLLVACGGESAPAEGFGDFGSGGAGGEAAVSSASTSSSSASTTAAATTTSAGAGGAGGESSGAGAAPPGCDYAASTDCAGGEEIASVDGDGGGDVRTLSGTKQKWFRLYVAEGSILSKDLAFSATIDSPAGMNWDLYVYAGDSSTPNCFADPDPAQGSPETYTKSWSDTLGTEDGTWFVLEVRYGGGELCDEAAKWTLTVVGNP